MTEKQATITIAFADSVQKTKSGEGAPGGIRQCVMESVEAKDEQNQPEQSRRVDEELGESERIVEYDVYGGFIASVSLVLGQSNEGPRYVVWAMIICCAISTIV